jgi:hypothetical protein
MSSWVTGADRGELDLARLRESRKDIAKKEKNWWIRRNVEEGGRLIKSTGSKWRRLVYRLDPTKRSGVVLGVDQ